MDQSRDQSRPDCIFCQIISGEAPILASNPRVSGVNGIAYQDDWFVAFPDAAPVAPFHTLLVTRSHHLAFAELTANIRDAANVTLSAYSDYLQRYRWHGTPIVSVMLEHGSSSAEEILGCIAHSHMHVVGVPRAAAETILSIEGFTRVDSARSVWEACESAPYYLVAAKSLWASYSRITQSLNLECRQFLRRVVANVLDRGEWADYNAYRSGRIPSPEVEEIIKATQVALLRFSGLHRSRPQVEE